MRLQVDKQSAPTHVPHREAGVPSRLRGALATFQRLRQQQSLLTTLIPLAAIWVWLAVSSRYFLTVDNVTNILLQSVPLALIAGGMTLNLVAAEIDLSVGSVVALISAVAAFSMVNLHQPWPVAILAALCVGVCTGFVNAWFTTAIGVPSFVVTLAMMGIARGAALLVTHGEAIVGLPASFDYIGQGRLVFVPVAVLIAAFILALLHFTLTQTKFGLDVYAVGGNVEAARIAGVNVRHIKSAVLVLSAVLASVAGLVLGARLDAGSGSIGYDLLLDSIAAVVIGGTSLLGGVGRISGTVLGVLMISSIRNGLVLLNVSDFWQEIAIGVVILLAVAADHLAKGRED